MVRVWCPNCGDEYREGFDRCAECDVGFVAGPTSASTDPAPRPAQDRPNVAAHRVVTRAPTHSERGLDDIQFPIARRVADVFKMLAVLTCITAALGAVVGAHYGAGGDNVIAYVTVELMSGIIGASMFAFFGYVLDVLVSTYAEVRRVRLTLDTDGVAH